MFSYLFDERLKKDRRSLKTIYRYLSIDYFILFYGFILRVLCLAKVIIRLCFISFFI